VSFSSVPGGRYVVLAPEAAKAVSRVEADPPSDLRNPTNQSDYMIITIDEFTNAAQSLVSYRQGQGLKATVVRLQDIYDEFNWSNPDPAAIRAFLEYAWQYWERYPRYVVLGGKGTYDYKNCRGYSECKIPVAMVGTPQGLALSDGWFADFNGDLVPEMSVGRLPAVTAEELQTMVNKIIAYESAVSGDWQKRLIAVSDNPDDGGDFDGASDQVMAEVSADYAVQPLKLSKSSPDQLNSDLLNAINSGAAFLNYFGHAGPAWLAEEGLLSTSDVPSLNNGNRLVAMSSMSCAMGNFAIPGYPCLGEDLLQWADGGAVVVWAPSGLSLNDEARKLDDAFYTAIFRDKDAIFGDAIRKAQRQYKMNGTASYLLQIYNLIGDPATRITGFAASAPDTSNTNKVTTFEEWKAKWFAPEDSTKAYMTADDADPDGDGLINLVEYATGRNPRRADKEQVFSMDSSRAVCTNGFDVLFSFKRLKSRGNIEYIVEMAPDLENNWHQESNYVQEAEVTDDGNGQTETVKYGIRSPAELNTARFIRFTIRKSVP
jgi:hypothetical protein